ncbi:MAG: glycosyltransferase family 9 protein [Bacteroidales bacterium]|nr:glycosyltransferase family 9 protein [Bacteroidales bacterium]
MRIILSRTDGIGDVVLTLPMAGALKEKFPDCTIIFLGRNYTRPVIECSRFIDQFVSWDDASRDPDPISFLASLQAGAIIHAFPVKEICRTAKKARIPLRIATARRYFTWFTCNRLLHIPRRNSDLHEAQLNLKMLGPLGINRTFSLSEIPALYGFLPALPDIPIQHPAPGKLNLILHPKSKGSAREWGLDNFSKLIDLLPKEKFNIMVTGTTEEGAMMRKFLEKYHDRVQDMTGKLNLAEFISLIHNSDALVAASTGPLHLAAASGIHAIGLYAPMRPIFPTRWAPLGKNADFLVIEKQCRDCRKTTDCQCIRDISPESVAERLTISEI